MATSTFYWKPSCTTCRNAKKFLEERGVETDDRDINREPPAREFLERHIKSESFLDFVSKRSPVFKKRPLPKSKKEAIDLMMKEPNLIKRPILIRGNRVIFGFDKDAYGSL